jgi:hypothetical protein
MVDEAACGLFTMTSGFLGLLDLQSIVAVTRFSKQVIAPGEISSVQA